MSLAFHLQLLRSVTVRYATRQLENVAFRNFFMRQENIEFIALFEASGWSRREAIARLQSSKSNISRYLSGEMAPNPQVLELFKMILAAERPGVLSAAACEIREEPLAPWERKIIEDLRWLHEEDRERVIQAIQLMIRGLATRTPVRYSKSDKRSGKPSSLDSSFQTPIAPASALAVARREIREKQQRSQAAGTTSGKRAPTGDAHRETKHTPE